MRTRVDKQEQGQKFSQLSWPGEQELHRSLRVDKRKFNELTSKCSQQSEVVVKRENDVH